MFKKKKVDDKTSSKKKKVEDKTSSKKKNVEEKPSSKIVSFRDKLDTNGEKEFDESSLTQSDVSIQQINDSINHLEKIELKDSNIKSNQDSEIQELLAHEALEIKAKIEKRSSVISSEVFNKEIRKLR